MFRHILLGVLQRLFGADRVRLKSEDDRPAIRSSKHRPDPRSLDEALQQLQDYCTPYFRSDFPGVAIPKEFWKITNDELFYQVLGFMPLFVPQELLDRPDVPPGFRLAWPIFSLEDDYHFNGWTAISNAGETILRNAVESFRSIGMQEEATALEAALRVYLTDPENEEGWAAAYRSVPNPYEEGDNKNEALRAYFSRNRHLFGGG